MRIVGGIYGGRTIAAPRGASVTRPTTDKVREALMSSVTARIGGGLEGVSVLDAFAGTGAFGLEALSRGAAHCTFLDRDRGAVSTVMSNIATLGVPDGLTSVWKTDAFVAAHRGKLPGAPFDLVFLDPPYATAADRVCELVLALEDGGLLAPGAIVLYEHDDPSFDLAATCCAGRLEEVSSRRYGKTEVCIMRTDGGSR